MARPSSLKSLLKCLPAPLLPPLPFPRRAFSAALRRVANPYLLAAILVVAASAWGAIFVRYRAVASVQSHIAAGIAAANSGKARLAGEEWRAAVALDPKRVEAWTLLAELYLSTEDWSRGDEAFEQLLRLDPATPHGHGNRATCLYMKGDRMGGYKEAVVELKKDPNFIPALVICARTAVQVGQPKQESDSLARLVTLLPNSVPLHKLYAEHLVYNSRYADAEPVLQRLMTLTPNEPQAYWLRGMSRFNSLPNLENSEQAEKDFRHAIALSPTIPISHLYLGKLYRRQGKLNEAIAELELAHRLAPQQITICLELSKAYEQAGKSAQAAPLRQLLTKLQEEDTLRNSLEKRCVNDRDNFDNHLQLGQLFIKNGDYHKALYFLNRAVFLRPGDTRAKQELERLGQLARSAPPEKDVASTLLTEHSLPSLGEHP